MSRYPALAVDLIVSSRSSISASPSRANWRKRRSATLILRVPSSTESSRFLYSRLSQTFTALKFLFLSWPMRTPSGLYPSEPKGEVPPVPIHLLPPSWRPSCSSRRFFSSSIILSQPPNFSISAFSSSVRNFSVSVCSQSSGISAISPSPRLSSPLKTVPKTWSNLSRLRSSFTNADFDK